MSDQGNKKKQHYVPQNYLRRFANEDETLYVYDKTSSKIYPSRVRDVAEENYFYKIPEHLVEQLFKGTPLEGEDIDLQTFENALAVFEGYFYRTVNSLLSGIGKRRISGPERGMMGFFIVLQVMRTRKSRNKMLEIREKYWNVLMERFFETKFPGTPKDLYPTLKWEDDKGITPHLHHIFDVENLKAKGEELEQHIWLIGVNNTARPLYTSDHPVVAQGHAPRLAFKNDSLLSPGLEIAYPLTPGHILLIFERNHFYLRQTWDGGTLLLDEDEVAYYNEMQILQSHRQIYCPIDDFAGVAEVCAENPNNTVVSEADIQEAVDQLLKDCPFPDMPEEEIYPE